jgi:hypothetical protein
MPTRPNADWPADTPPLSIAAETAEGRALTVFISYEIPDRRPVTVIRSGSVEIRPTGAVLRRIAQLAVDHERLEARARGEEADGRSVPADEGDHRQPDPFATDSTRNATPAEGRLSAAAPSRRPFRPVPCGTAPDRGAVQSPPIHRERPADGRQETDMKRIVLAALLATGLAAGAAQAQVSEPGTGLVPAGGSIVGGGVAAMTGSGDEARVTYAASGAGGGGGAYEQAGRLATFAGSDGDGRPRWTYAAPAAASGAGTGREAWMTGGGDDAQIVYGGRPR